MTSRRLDFLYGLTAARALSWRLLGWLGQRGWRLVRGVGQPRKEGHLALLRPKPLVSLTYG